MPTVSARRAKRDPRWGRPQTTMTNQLYLKYNLYVAKGKIGRPVECRQFGGHAAAACVLTLGGGTHHGPFAQLALGDWRVQ